MVTATKELEAVRFLVNNDTARRIATCLTDRRYKATTAFYLAEALEVVPSEIEQTLQEMEQHELVLSERDEDFVREFGFEPIIIDYHLSDVGYKVARGLDKVIQG